MLLRRFIFGGIALAALIYLLLRPPEPEIGDPQLVEQQFSAMGTWFSVSVWLDDAAQREAAEAAIARSESQLHAYAHKWRPEGDGALGRLNAELADGGAITVPESMRPLFETAEIWRRRSEGALDARIGGLVALWGFDSEENFASAPPDDAALSEHRAQLAAAPVFDGAEYGPAEGIVWNFGAIAKGEAVAEASATLRAAGFDNHIVNAGGDLVVRGVRGDRAWRVAVRHPRPGIAQNLLAAVEVGDEAVFTSGDYERFFEHEGERYHHILNPDTGRPARDLRSVTVVHDDALTADAASTALFVAGEDWRAMAERLEVGTVMVMYDDGSLGMTETARSRFRQLADAPLRDAP